MKIFGIGLPKTGTTSLAHALRRLGYKHKHYTEELTVPVISGDLGPVMTLVRNYDSFTDLPFTGLYERLDRAFPASKFILTTRNRADWLKSCVRHFGSAARRPPHIGGAIREWYFGASHPADDPAAYLDAYDQHHERVLAYFAGRPLLVVSWEDGHGWDELCGFLGRSAPAEPFPHLRPPFCYGETLPNETPLL